MNPDYRDRDPRGWCGDPSRGAALGRGTWAGDPDYRGRLTLRHIRLNGGGYDANGTYFGHGDPLYWVASTDDDASIDRMIRARNRADARQQVLEMYPRAKVRR